MKKLLVCLIALAFSLTLFGCDTMDDLTSSTASVNSLPASSAIESSSMVLSSEPVSGQSAISLKVDWNKCTEDTKANIVGGSYSYARDFSAQVDESKQLITLTGVLNDSIDPQKALDYADTMLRQFNTFAAQQDPSIAQGSKDSYGGLYDTYQVMIGIAPQSKTGEQSQWFVFDSIGKGIQTQHKIDLQKTYK